MRFDRKQFFDGIRGKLVSQLTQSQVDAIEFLLAKFEATAEWSSLRHIAYAFATIGHETDWTFRPIKEYRSDAGTKARANQDRYWLSGFYGRGYVQLTWKRNYERASDELGFDFVSNPNAVMQPEHAFDILTRGMFEGWFTGKDLNDYITATKTDYFNARRIINGEDKAEKIANYAKRFEAALRISLIEEGFADLTDGEISTATTAEPQLIPPDIQPDTSLEQKTVAVNPHAVAPTQNAEAIVNVGGEAGPPANFVPEDKTADAPEATGFLAKLQTQGAALFALIGGAAGAKEIFGIQLSAETVQLLSIVVPVVLILGFLGFLTWYVSEKVVGFKTLKMQSEINTDPNRHNLKIKPQ